MNPLLIGTAGAPIPAAQVWARSYDGRHGPLIDLAQAVPGEPPPDAMLDRLAAAAGAVRSTAYGPILGDSDLRGALAADIAQRYDATVSGDDIAITAGCNQAFFVTLIALAQAGDDVIVPLPWYFNHKMTLDMLGIGVRPLPCEAARAFVPDPAKARALIGPRTKAIVLVTPNNPTGAIYPAETIAAFATVAAEAGIALIVDETYRDFLPEGQGKPHGLLSNPRWRDTIVHLYSFSKSYAIPGHRLGAIVAGGAFLDQVAKVLDCMQICAPRAAQAAAAWAVEGIRPWREQVRARINARAAVFRDTLRPVPGWSISAIGAYFAYVRHPFATAGVDAAAQVVRQVGVLALPGGFFGPGQDDHLRIAFANVDDAALAQVGARLHLVA